MYKEYDIAPSNTKNFDLKIFCDIPFQMTNKLMYKLKCN